MPRDLHLIRVALRPDQVEAMTTLTQERRTTLSGVVRDAVGLWMQENHGSWVWNRSGPRHRARQKFRPNANQARLVLTLAQYELLRSTAPLYGSIAELVGRAVDAHITRMEMEAA